MSNEVTYVIRKVSCKLFKLPHYSLLSLSKQGTLSLYRRSFEAQQLFGGSSAEAAVWQQRVFFNNPFLKILLVD